jgi:hypothetical protein
MPRKAVDYSKTIMYKIVCNDLSVTDVYVGYTTDFRKRKNTHKSYCINQNSNHYNLKVYQMIRQNGGWDNFSMIQIEEYCCNNSNEASARERYWYEFLNANLNKQVPNRSKKEHTENNKETIATYKKKWYKKNKEKINEKIVCECGGNYTYVSKSKHFKTQKHQNYIQSLVNENNII